MPEMIISASGIQYGLRINAEGSINTNYTVPNYAKQFIYDSYGNIGSIISFLGNGSQVQVFTWANGSVLTNIGSLV